MWLGWRYMYFSSQDFSPWGISPTQKKAPRSIQASTRRCCCPAQAGKARMSNVREDNDISCSLMDVSLRVQTENRTRVSISSWEFPKGDSTVNCFLDLTPVVARGELHSVWLKGGVIRKGQIGGSCTNLADLSCSGSFINNATYSQFVRRTRCNVPPRWCLARVLRGQRPLAVQGIYAKSTLQGIFLDIASKDSQYVYQRWGRATVPGHLAEVYPRQLQWRWPQRNWIVPFLNIHPEMPKPAKLKLRWKKFSGENMLSVLSALKMALKIQKWTKKKKKKWKKTTSLM